MTGVPPDAPSERSQLRRLGMFPLSAVLYPHAQMPLHVFEPRYRELTRDCLAGDSRFGVVLIERGKKCRRRRPTHGGRHVCRNHQGGPPLRWALGAGRPGGGEDPGGRVVGRRPLPAGPGGGVAAPRRGRGALVGAPRRTEHRRRTRGLLSESGRSSALPAEARFDDDPDVASWQLCSEAPLNMMDAQRLLSASGTLDRLELLVELTDAMEQDLHRMLASGVWAERPAGRRHRGSAAGPTRATASITTPAIRPVVSRRDRAAPYPRRQADDLHPGGR